jgi:hypothetical protein
MSAVMRTYSRNACPEIGALMHYRDRVVRVLAEASGQRVMIESVDAGGRQFVSTVKWLSLTGLNDQLF